MLLPHYCSLMLSSLDTVLLLLPRAAVLIRSRLSATLRQESTQIHLIASPGSSSLLMPMHQETMCTRASQTQCTLLLLMLLMMQISIPAHQVALHVSSDLVAASFADLRLRRPRATMCIAEGLDRLRCCLMHPKRLCLSCMLVAQSMAQPTQHSALLCLLLEAILQCCCLQLLFVTMLW